MSGTGTAPPRPTRGTRSSSGAVGRPLVLFTRRDGDLLPGFVISLVGIVLGATGIILGVIGRRGVGSGRGRRRANAGIWLGAAAIPAGAIVFVVLVEEAVSAFEF